MGYLVTCKNEEDPIKNEGARVVTTLFINFSDSQGQLTPVSNGILPKSKLIQVLIVVFIIARMRKIHSKLKALEWSQYFSHYKSMGIFSSAQGQVTP